MDRVASPLGTVNVSLVGGDPGRVTDRAAHASTRQRGRWMTLLQIVFGAPERDPGGVIPTAIYTVLPHLYVCAGVLTIIVLGNAIAVFSALVLFAAAGIVWARRYRYRAPFIRSGGRIDLPTVIDEEGEAEEFVQIFWQPTFECGHTLLDAQHRRLFGLGNELVKAVIAKRLPGDIAWIVDVLIHHVTDHFCAEEAVLAKAKHPICQAHREEHRALLDKAVALRDRYGHGEVPNSDLVRFIVCDLITDHIAGEAVQFTSLWSSRHSRTKRRRRSSRHGADSG